MALTEPVSRLARAWRDAGIRESDTVLVHSSLSRTLKRMAAEGAPMTPEQVLESLVSAVGESGTLLLPLFNFSFTEGHPFDIRSTPSQMGALTEAGRRHPAAVRTGHPIYSFAAIGRHSAELAGIDNFSGYGDDSPFGFLRKVDGKIAIIDLPDQHSMTFYHHVEEMNRVDYRYNKVFRGEYVDWQGNSSLREYGLFVRNLERGVRTHVDPTGELLWREGIYRGDRPGEGAGMRVASANRVFDRVTEIIAAGEAEGMLYEIQR